MLEPEMQKAPAGNRGLHKHSSTDQIDTHSLPQSEGIQRAVEDDLIMYRRGWSDALHTYPPCQHTHPAIAASVREMFGGWDGAAQAAQRSVARFKAEQQQGVNA